MFLCQDWLNLYQECFYSFFLSSSHMFLCGFCFLWTLFLFQIFLDLFTLFFNCVLMSGLTFSWTISILPISLFFQSCCCCRCCCCCCVPETVIFLLFKHFSLLLFLFCLGDKLLQILTSFFKSLFSLFFNLKTRPFTTRVHNIFVVV